MVLSTSVLKTPSNNSSYDRYLTAKILGSTWHSAAYVKNNNLCRTNYEFVLHWMEQPPFILKKFDSNNRSDEA